MDDAVAALTAAADSAVPDAGCAAGATLAVGAARGAISARRLLSALSIPATIVSMGESASLRPAARTGWESMRKRAITASVARACRGEVDTVGMGL